MRIRRFVATLSVAAVVAAGAVVTAPAIGAADFGPVTNTADDGNATSLRWIIENDATNAGGDTVILESGADYLLTCAQGGDISHGSTPLTIEGNGATIRMEDGCDERILRQGEALLTLRNLTIRDGGDGGGPDGGGFSAAGDVVLDGASILDNEGDDAGGFEADGTVEMYGSTISGNSTDEADWAGGFYAGSDVTIVESTISGNQADSGGGGLVFECGADVMVVRSSITGNTAVGAGGALLEGCDIDGAPEPSTVTVVNSTISGNSAFTGGGIYAELATVNLVYTTLAANTATNVEPASVGVADDASDAGDPSDDVRTLQGPVDNVIAGALGSFGTVVAYPTNGVNCEVFDGTGSSGYNYADDLSCGFDQATDRMGAADPLLGPLAANGGPTLTHLPQTGSPLIDAIPVAACGGGDALAGSAVTTDQRGITRPQATGCEIGSVEIEAPVALEPNFTG